MPGLASILTQITYAKAKEDLVLIEKFTDQTLAGSSLKDYLLDCVDDYNLPIIIDLPTTMEDLDENHLNDAFDTISMAREASLFCEDELSLTP